MQLMLQKYYEALYTPIVYLDPKALTDFFTNIDLPKLSLDQVKLLDGPVTETEIGKSALGMTNGKSPGLDGFPVEYYRQFIGILAPILEEVHNELMTQHPTKKPELFKKNQNNSVCTLKKKTKCF